MSLKHLSLVPSPSQLPRVPSSRPSIEMTLSRTGFCLMNQPEISRSVGPSHRLGRAMKAGRTFVPPHDSQTKPQDAISESPDLHQNGVSFDARTKHAHIP